MVMGAASILCKCGSNAINCCHCNILPYSIFNLQDSLNVYDYKQVNVLYIKFHLKLVKCTRGVVVGF